MPAVHPEYVRGQFIRPPDLQHISTFLAPAFGSLAEAENWAEAERRAGRPLLDGQVIRTLGDYRLYHWRTDRFVAQFTPPPTVREPTEPVLGELPSRQLSWSQKPVVVDPPRLWQLYGEGRLPVADAPFTSTAGPGAGLAVETGDANHQTATLTVGQRITFTADVECELLAIGSGGPGQNWTRNGWTDNNVRYAGGAGGGAGATAYLRRWFGRGESFLVRVGITGSRRTWQSSCTVVGDLLFAAGGHPFVSGTSWRSPSRVDDEDGNTGNPRVSGGGAGSETEYNTPTTSRYRNQPTGTVVSSSIPVIPAVRLPVTNYRAFSGRRGLAIKQGTQNQNGVAYWAWMAGGGGGAGGSPARQTVTAWAAGRAHTLGGLAASNPGGAGLSVPWWPTARKYGYGGPPGDWATRGNTVYEGGILVAGAPVTYGSGGAGGGGDNGLTGGLGQPGVLLIRWPTAGNSLTSTIATMVPT